MHNVLITLFQETISKIKDKKFYRELLMQDQLKMTKSSQEAFFGFSEFNFPIMLYLSVILFLCIFFHNFLL